jgi:uncharacterized protein (DUF2141 family)
MNDSWLRPLRLPISLLVLGAASLLAAQVPTTTATTAAPRTPTLRVVLGGVQSHPGIIHCSVFSSSRGFPNEASRAFTRTVMHRDGSLRVCDFLTLAPGKYAVSVLHDEDGDGSLDTSFFGAPTEGWGSTNNVTHAMSGPTFEESAFTLRPNTTRVSHVTMHY